MTKIDENIAKRFWEAYKTIEEDFVEIIKFIPFEKEEEDQNEITNKDTYSFKLADIIIRSCTKIDSLLKYLTKVGYIEFEDNERKNELLGCQRKIEGKEIITIDNYKKLYGENLMSSKIEVHLRKVDLIFFPFSDFSWWTTYNRLKHDFHNNIKEAILWNAIKSLGALFSITCSIIELREYLFKNKIIWSPNFLNWIDYCDYIGEFPNSKINLFADTDFFGREISKNKNNEKEFWIRDFTSMGELTQ